MIKYKFAVFILSHGRADNVITIKTLRKCNYSGKIYLICDNEDQQIEQYKKLSEVEDVLIFNKLEQMKVNDTMNNFNEHNIVLYARNTCFDFAKSLELDYFLELDDDYHSFEFRTPADNKLKVYSVKNLDNIINSYLDYLSNSNITALAFAQGGDLLGGVNNELIKKKYKRKVMNSFFCKTDRPFSFIGSINEDANMYIVEGIKGKIFLTIPIVSLTQNRTQSKAGGLTDIYLERGTYIKSFYSVMCAPSCVKIAIMGDNHKRIHHKIIWENCTPKIINEKYKKV